MSSHTTTVRGQQRTVTTTGGSLPFGLTFEKIALATILLKITSTVLNIISYAVLYKDRKTIMVEVLYGTDWTRPGQVFAGAETLSRVENLTTASDLLVQLCLCFWIVNFMMIITNFSLKPSFGLKTPNEFGFDTVYHLVAGLLLGGTALTVLGLQGQKINTSGKNMLGIHDEKNRLNIFADNNDQSPKEVTRGTTMFAVGGALAFIAAILHLLHFVLSLISWKRVETVH